MAWIEGESYIELRYHENEKTKDRAARVTGPDRKSALYAAKRGLQDTLNLVDAIERLVLPLKTLSEQEFNALPFDEKQQYSLDKAWEKIIVDEDERENRKKANVEELDIEQKYLDSLGE